MAEENIFFYWVMIPCVCCSRGEFCGEEEFGRILEQKSGVIMWKANSETEEKQRR